MVVVNLSTHYRHTGENNWGDKSPHKRISSVMFYSIYVCYHISYDERVIVLHQLWIIKKNPVTQNINYRVHYNLCWGTKMTYISIAPDGRNKSEVVCKAKSKCVDLAGGKWLQDTPLANIVPTISGNLCVWVVLRCSFKGVLLQYTTV